MPRPDLSRIPEFYHSYINQVQQDEIMSAFKEQTSVVMDFFNKIPAEKVDYRYAEGKWTIKEMLQHIVDAERIFAYRGLCIARKERNSLPGFDENEYADNSKADTRSWNELLEEFKLIRRTTEILFGSFDEEQLQQTGISNSKPVYVLAIGYVIIGHAIHHTKVIKERYL
jgi:uncharacterized damage-inducible protein DinB